MGWTLWLIRSRGAPGPPEEGGSLQEVPFELPVWLGWRDDSDAAELFFASIHGEILLLLLVLLLLVLLLLVLLLVLLLLVLLLLGASHLLLLRFWWW